MDTTIRNLDDELYRALKARAAHAGKTIGEVVNEAARAYLAQPDPFARRRSLADWKPADLGEGSEHLSDEIDRIVYGVP